MRHFEGRAPESETHTAESLLATELPHLITKLPQDEVLGAILYSSTVTGPMNRESDLDVIILTRGNLQIDKLIMDGSSWKRDQTLAPAAPGGSRFIHKEGARKIDVWLWPIAELEEAIADKAGTKSVKLDDGREISPKRLAERIVSSGQVIYEADSTQIGHLRDICVNRLPSGIGKEPYLPLDERLNTLIHQEIKEQRELLWPPEKLSRLPELIQDQAIEHMRGQYELGPEKKLYVYHDAYKEDGTDGHIANVGRIWELYKRAVLWHSTQAEQSFPPNEQADPLQIYSSCMQKIFMRARSDESYEAYLRSCSPERLQDLISLSIKYAIKIHDLGDVVQKINWKEIKEGKPIEECTEFKEKICLDPSERPLPEVAAARMFNSFIKEFAEELGLKSKHEINIVRLLGSHLIRATAWDRAYQFSGDLPQLALLDQIASMFNPNGLEQIIGLLNEKAVYDTTHLLESEGLENLPELPPASDPEREAVEEKINYLEIRAMGYNQTIMRDDYIGNFVTSQLRVYEEKRGTSQEQIFKLLEKFRQDAPEQFSEIMEVNEEEMAKIPNLQEFFLNKLDLRLHFAKIIWPGEGEKAFIVSPFTFRYKTPAAFEIIRRGCELYKDRFWDPNLKAEDFDRLANDVLARYSPKQT